MRCKGTEVSYRTLPPLERDGEREREIYLETHPDISLLTVIAQALSTQDISLTIRSHFSDSLDSWRLTYHSEPLPLTHLPVGVNFPDSLSIRSHFPRLTYLSESLLLTHLPSGVTSLTHLPLGVSNYLTPK